MGVMRTGSIGFVTDPESHRQGEPLGETPPFRILILGNFKGRRSGDGWKTAAPLMIDRDNFDAVLARMKPSLVLETGTDDGPIELSFEEIDDFHPDRIYAKVPLFDKMRDLKSRFFATGAPASEPDAPGEAGGNVLDMILGATQAREIAQPRSNSPIEAFFREVSEAHAVRSDDPAAAAIRAGVDGALGRLMSSILHDPRFQSLEAAWRSLDRLVRKLDTGKTLSVWIFDVDKAELADDFARAAGLKNSTIYRQFVEPTLGEAGAPPWCLIAADYVFEPTQADVVLLGFLGMIAQAGGSTVVSGVSPRVLGCERLNETPDARSWKRDPDEDGVASYEALRTLPVANRIGLVLPRVLLRLPYSRLDKPIESFDFEEFVGGGSAKHEEFLWGNASYLIAELLGRSFEDDEWNMTPGTRTEILDLPVYVDRSEVDADALPCAEVVLTQSAIEAILDRGVMPMLSYKNRDATRLARFQSIAAPNAPLAGRWD